MWWCCKGIKVSNFAFSETSFGWKIAWNQKSWKPKSTLNNLFWKETPCSAKFNFTNCEVFFKKRKNYCFLTWPNFLNIYEFRSYFYLQLILHPTNLLPQENLKHLKIDTKNGKDRKKKHFFGWNTWHCCSLMFFPFWPWIFNVYFLKNSPSEC